jgi:hypothetical protein
VATQVAGGGHHSIALTLGGIVRCWGAGMIDTGNPYNYGQSMVPANLGPCTQVAAGGVHSIALRADGTVRCWGNNDLFQSAVPANLGQRTQVAGGDFHTLALLSASDSDGDGIPAPLDNCPNVFNPAQSDCDGDNVGDACELPQDCNSNGTNDDCEIANGDTPDFNNNGIPDSCECLADLTADGLVNGADLGIMLAFWGPVSTFPAADINHDGNVNGADLGVLLGDWGACPN